MGEDGDFLNRKDYDEDGYGKVSDTVKPQDGLLYYYQKNGGMELNERTGTHFNRIKMLICVTMYAEDRQMLKNTLKGIQRNVKNFKEYNISQEQIVVVVIQDGILKMQGEMEDLFNELDEEREANMT